MPNTIGVESFRAKAYGGDHCGVDMDRFSNIGVIKNGPEFDLARIEHFESAIAAMRKHGS